MAEPSCGDTSIAVWCCSSAALPIARMDHLADGRAVSMRELARRSGRDFSEVMSLVAAGFLAPELVMPSSMADSRAI